MPPAPQQTVPPVFSIKVDNGLYLDNQGKFSASPSSSGAPVYSVAGGLLSLSTRVKGQMIDGTLAILPLKDGPAWRPKLRNLGLDEGSLDFLEKVSGLVGDIVTVVGWAQAALKLAEWIGILKSGPSVEQLAAQILANTEIIKEMIAQGQQNELQAWLDDSRIVIRNRQNEVEGGVPGYESAVGTIRYDRRAALLVKLDDAVDEVGKILAESRWKQFYLHKFYNGSSRKLFFLKCLAADGVTWADVEWPADGALPFDYRGAQPHASYGVLSYLTMLKMIEPEFRSTGLRRPSLIALADDLAARMGEMRKVLARTILPPGAFGWGLPDGLISSTFGIATSFRKPLGYWAAGAIDLRSGTTAFFQNAGTALPLPAQGEPPITRRATMEFDWIPPNAELKAFEYQTDSQTTAREWRIQNLQAVAEEANRQSMEDYAQLVVSSGFLTLARLEASLRHLATDPDVSETVDGSVHSKHQLLSTHEAEVVGYAGIVCTPENVTATVPLRQFGCRASVDLQLQPPGRDYSIPYSFSLVALSAPAGEVYAGILSEQPLAEGTQDVTLAAARTFDWYIEESPVIEVVPRPSDKVLAYIARRTQAMHMLVRGAEYVPEMIGDATDIPGEDDAVPNGEMRHTSDEPITLRCTLSLSESGTSRGAEVVVETLRPEEPDTSSRRNIQYLYVAIDEVLASGATIRTYFDVSMNRQMHIVPPWFFEKERECIDQTERLIDHINDRFSEQATQLPPWVPRSRFTILTHAQRLLQDSPEIVEQAIRELSDG